MFLLEQFHVRWPPSNFPRKCVWFEPCLVWEHFYIRWLHRNFLRNHVSENKTYENDPCQCMGIVVIYFSFTQMPHTHHISTSFHMGSALELSITSHGNSNFLVRTKHTKMTHVSVWGSLSYTSPLLRCHIPTTYPPHTHQLPYGFRSKTVYNVSR